MSILCDSVLQATEVEQSAAAAAGGGDADTEAQGDAAVSDNVAETAREDEQ